MNECVRSGFCCTQAPCAFGEAISADDPQCKFLMADKTLVNPVTPPYAAVETRCAKYEEIIEHADAWVNPAFGAGCCQPLFNNSRAAILTIRDKPDTTSVKTDGQFRRTKCHSSR